MSDEKLKRILSVEDDEFMQMFIKDIFWLHGHKKFELVSANNLHKAEEIINNPQTRPELIILDVRLPVREGDKPDASAGLEFLKKLKADEKTKDIKVVVFSGFSDAEIKKEAQRLGAEKFLLKGENLPLELINAVSTAFVDNS